MTPDDRATLAFHESAHAVAAVALGVAVEVASLRPGQGYAAVVLMERPGVDLDRDATERRIVITLSGRVGETMAEPITGPVRADRSAARSLKRGAPESFAMLKAAEDADDDEADDAFAMRRAMALDDYDEHVATVHVGYLRVRALRVVERHRHALRAVAEALYERTVLTGAEVVAIVEQFRCSCHLWGPPSAFVPDPEPGKESIA